MRSHIDRAQAASKFKELVGLIPVGQLDVVRSVWRYFVDKGAWPAVREIHRREGRAQVEDAVTNLQGIFVWHERPEPVNYYLTLPAVLAIEGTDGASIKLILSYLRYIKERFKEDATFAQIESAHLQKNTDMTNDEITLLSHLIGLYPKLCGQCISGRGTSSWSAGVIQRIEELYEDDTIEPFLYTICNDYVEAYGHNPQNYPLPRLYRSIPPRTTIVIPDTNALIDKPRIMQWSIEGSNEFTVMLAPTVLSELDELKNKRDENDPGRKKAQDAIRNISEYINRGSLREGIMITDHVVLRMFLGNPYSYLNHFPWRVGNENRENRDDLILATVLNVKYHNIRSRVCIITNDLNVRCKANALNIEWLPMDKVTT